MKEQSQENDNIQKAIHNGLVDGGKVNDKFAHYCKAEGLAEHLTKCNHLEDIASNMVICFICIFILIENILTHSRWTLYLKTIATQFLST